ncbi:MAG: sodium:solute symporter family protein [Planctomycetota bacterium]
MHLRPTDYAVLAVYLLGVTALGLLLGRRRGEDDYFLAGRSMGVLPVGLSVMVTAFSAINVVAFSGEVFGHGLYVVASLPVFAVVAWPVTRWVIPFFARLRPTSAYSILARRFDTRMQRLASGTFMLWRIAWMAVVMLAAGKFLAVLTGTNLLGVIVVAGLVATLYTTVGGMRAVMWTDVVQFVVLVGGMATVVWLALGRVEGGLVTVLSGARQAGSLKPFVPFDPAWFSPDPRIRITLASGLVGTLVAFIARYGADQVVLQRYFAARTERAARRAVWLNVVAVLVSLVLLMMLGLVLVGSGPAVPSTRSSGLMLKRLASLLAELPAGVAGLVAAALLAATMSSIDSGINACSAAWASDFRRTPTPRRTRADRLLSLGLGLGCTALALVMARLLGPRQSIFVMVNRVVHGLGSPLLVMVWLGLVTRRVNAVGMLWGGLVGLAAGVAVIIGIEGLALHYYAVVTLGVSVGACLAASWMARLAGHDDPPATARFTWRAVMASPQNVDN